MFETTGLLQPIHEYGMCLACARAHNNGTCICKNCSEGPFTCYGNTLYECVNYTDGNRKVYKKVPTANVCSSCNTLWKKLVIYKRQPRNTIPHPLVTFRYGNTVENCVNSDPQPYTPVTPIKASLLLDITATRIHPWYLEPIKECFMCRSVYHMKIDTVSDNFDLCGPCIKVFRGGSKDKWMDRRLG
jgi:hypothetical protein